MTLSLVALSACSSSPGSTKQSAATKIGVTLILKELTNPYWVAMEHEAQRTAASDGIKLTIAAGTADADTTTQINAIQQAIARGDKGILVASNGDAISATLDQAKKAGLYVVALDTPLNPATTADITYATDNVEAGKRIGSYAAAALGGKTAVIAMLDAVASLVIPVDVERDHGFLQGMGINVGTGFLDGSEAKTGKYSGGNYVVACHASSNGSIDGGRTAIEKCLSANPNINVVYAISEPAAAGAFAGLNAQHKIAGVSFYTVDGSCSGLSSVRSGTITADAAQFPQKMVDEGLKAVVAATGGHGTRPSLPSGQTYSNTGSDLIALHAQPGVSSLTVDQAATTCWK